MPRGASHPRPASLSFMYKIADRNPRRKWSQGRLMPGAKWEAQVRVKQLPLIGLLLSFLLLTTHHTGSQSGSSLTSALCSLFSMSCHVPTYLESFTNPSIPSQSPKVRPYQLSLDYFDHLIVILYAFKVLLFLNLTKIRYSNEFP